MFFKKAIRVVVKATSSMRAKLTLSLMSIAAVLLISASISVMEYTSMSNYVSALIGDNISSVNVASRLSKMSNEYNLAILARIGEESSAELPDFDYDYFTSHCDSLRMFETNAISPLADSVMYSYAAYMLTSQELEDVIQSDFIDSRTWYFERLQPRFDRLNSDITALTEAIYRDLEKNSATFERGFYRSVIPGIVAVFVGLLLIFMLLFLILSYYVKPIYRMLDSLSAYRTTDKKYNCTFEGDDQLAELNEGISEIAEENRQLRSRIKALKK